MPDLNTDEDTAGSSAAEHQDAQAAESSAAEPTTDGIEAGSSPADGENEPSPLDIVEKALGSEESPTSQEDGEAKEQEPESKEAKAEGEDELPDEPTEEELNQANPRTKRRIETLLDQRKELREQVTDLETRASHWDQVEKFREANGMSPEAVANSIQIAALIENDPDRAYQVLDQIQSQLGKRTGASLPDDLRDAVKKGEITRERAFELSKAQARSQHLSERQKADEQRRQQAEEARQQEGHVNTLSEVSTSWDKAKAQSDPDWQEKRREVATRVERRLKAEGFPKSTEDMRAILDEEAKAVDALIGRFRPQGRALRPTPEGGSPRDAAPRQPKDHYDVVSMALGE